MSEPIVRLLRIPRPCTGAQIIAATRQACLAADTFVCDATPGPGTAYFVGETGNQGISVSPQPDPAPFELDTVYNGPLHISAHTWDGELPIFNAGLLRIEEFATKLGCVLLMDNGQLITAPQWPQIIQTCIYCGCAVAPNGRCPRHQEFVPTRPVRVTVVSES